MNPTNHPVEALIAETRAAFETESTIGRILERTKESLERFLAHPASLDHVKESLARVLARKSIPYGQPVDQDCYGSWRLYTDPYHFFASARRISAPPQAARRTTMASSAGRCTAFWWVRPCSKSTSVSMTAAYGVRSSFESFSVLA
jgi:hypothetical protein